MLRAITHQPSPRLEQCELTYLDAEPIDIERAASQHRAYCETLRQCGVEVTRLLF